MVDLHKIVTRSVMLWFFLGMFMIPATFVYTDEWCHSINHNPTQEFCDRIFVPSTMIWFIGIKHMIAVQIVLNAFAIYHNTFGRVNIPLLQVATLCAAIVYVGSIPHMYFSL